jgi:hypothetical protein
MCVITQDLTLTMINDLVYVRYTTHVTFPPKQANQ